jgi:stalled ribosome rescue protein Dom34
MKEIKYMGVWMDHSVAHLMEFTNDAIVKTTIESAFTHGEKEHSLSKSENLMHNKEQHQLSGYYKQISNILKDYQEVILFGPTTAKNELLNLLKADHHFEKTKIEVEQADKMTENQLHAFVKKYFQHAASHPSR